MVSDQILTQRPLNVRDHSIPLTAAVAGNVITITGNGGATLGKNSGSHRFNFTLTSPPGLTVRFVSLDAQDNCSTCPPAPGENSRQIVGVTIANGGASASFTDNNNNKGGPMDVSYQWNFSCDDPTKQVEPFDPVIRNGGGGGMFTRSLAVGVGLVGLAVIVALSLGYSFGN